MPNEPQHLILNAKAEQLKSEVRMNSVNNLLDAKRNNHNAGGGGVRVHSRNIM